MGQRTLWIIIAVALIAIPSTFIQGAAVQASQRRRQKGRVLKVPAPVKHTSPASKGDAVAYDLSVEVKKTPFGKVVILTNREKVSITIRNLIINDEWKLEKGNDNLLHSTKSWVSLPIELMLGDSLRIPISSYKREIIYIKLDTDKGVLTFKVYK